jgi:broad specificity phosphatase PhoE
MTTSVYLIRHGATALNREVPYRLLGRSLDPPLDEEGADQARRAADALASAPLVAVYSSPLRRALDTAAAIARPHGLSPIVDPPLIEASLGRWEGLTWDQARALDPDLYEAFHSRPGVVPYPDGESFDDARRRMVPAVARLAAEHPGGQIAVVSHNVTNRALLADLMGIPIDLARAIRQANGGISLIQYGVGAPVVETVNARFHLDVPGT